MRKLGGKGTEYCQTVKVKPVTCYESLRTPSSPAMVWILHGIQCFKPPLTKKHVYF